MTHRGSPSQTLHVGALARVEGEGAMHVEVRDGHVTDVQLQIYEPPRFFEALLRGRAFSEPPDITARICGICPVAYQMSACAAIEDACAVSIDPAVSHLRRLLYCGEWIESHALHVYLLHAPDFLGFDGAVELARTNRSIVERGLQLKKAGNQIMEAIGGRAIHPVNVRVGGFYRVPSPEDLSPLAERLRWALDAALATVRWVAGFDFPHFDIDHELLAVSQAGTYPIDAGERLSSSGGLDVDVKDFEGHVIEEHVARSNALHARLDGRGSYMVGPLARYSLNSSHLSPLAREAAIDAGLGAVCRNPFRSIIVRSVELVYACEESLRLIERYEPPARPFVAVAPRAAVGYGCTEAPRGALYHRYDLAADGTILAARIVPPTSQNQAAIEQDLRRFVDDRLDLPTPALTAACEQAIRNYDPCISCATHFLDLRVDRQ
jgi:coenzyme F420-reducing hydrogenase alpha subunit